MQAVGDAKDDFNLNLQNAIDEQADADTKQLAALNAQTNCLKDINGFLDPSTFNEKVGEKLVNLDKYGAIQAEAAAQELMDKGRIIENNGTLTFKTDDKTGNSILVGLKNTIAQLQQ